MEYGVFDTVEQFLVKKATLANTPLTAGMELLPLCNMNCDMCFVRLSLKELKQKGRIRTADEWLGLAKQMHAAGTMFVQLTGGEPLLHPEFKEIYLGLRNMGMVLTINTNGTLIDEAWADFFAQHKPRRINLTIYGVNEDTYTNLCHFPGGFEKAKNAVILLRERNIDVKINGTLVRNNCRDDDALVCLANELGVFLDIDTYMFPASRERDRPFDQQSRLLPEEAAFEQIKMMKMIQPKEYEARLKDIQGFFTQLPVLPEGNGKSQCRAGRSSFVITWQGNMQPCAMMDWPSVSVFEIGFNEAWKQTVNQMESYRLCPDCDTCEYRVFCRKCAASMYLETGRFDGTPEYLCRYTKEIVRLLREAVAP